MVVFDKKIKSSFKTAAAVVDEIVALLKDQAALDKSLSFRVGFMLREILNNAVEHGNQFDEDKQIHVCVEKNGDILVFKVTDEGPGFELDILTDLPEDIDRVRNRGILLIIEFGFAVKTVKNQVMVMLDLFEATNNL